MLVSFTDTKIDWDAYMSQVGPILECPECILVCPLGIGNGGSVNVVLMIVLGECMCSSSGKLIITWISYNYKMQSLTAVEFGFLQLLFLV